MSLTLTMKESGGFGLHEEGEYYEGTLTHIEDLPDGQYGPGLKWIINIDGETAEDGSAVDTWAFSSQTLSPRSKLYKWAKGILGEQALPAAGETFDLGRLVGARVKIMFEQAPGVDPEGNPITREKVVAFKSAGPISSQVPSASPTPAAPAAQPDAEPF